LKPGASAEMTIDETGRTYPVRVDRLSGAVDAVNQSIKAYGRITGPAPDLLPGMSGTATFSPKAP
jgi:multidrug efflux pump subunit AcrA (membrane-fusion protein)